MTFTISRYINNKYIAYFLTLPPPHITFYSFVFIHVFNQRVSNTSGSQEYYFFKPLKEIDHDIYI